VPGEAGNGHQTEDMRVAIVHFHLRSGGVYRVVRHTLKAFQEDPQVRFGILVGDAPGGEEFPEGSYARVDALRYEGEYERVSVGDLVAQLKTQAHKLLGGAPDLWHFHNHALGKNYLVPRVVELMAREGQKLLLQIHDFAEDGRPENFRNLLRYVGDNDLTHLGNTLYPSGRNVHYGLLNGRDMNFLETAGANPDRLHLLTNPVSFGAEDAPGDPGEGDYVLYPTRAIRRKNLGEFLLLAMLDEQTARGRTWAVTMAPENPKAKPIYEDWVRLAKDLNLNIEFEWGRRGGLEFPELIRRSQFLVTTSVGEGFGLAFLEPWLMGKRICGRNLPEVTEDFAGEGIELHGLYRCLNVPYACFDAGAFRDRIAHLLDDYYRAYEQTPPHDVVDRFFADAGEGDSIDFGRLDETAQKEVLRSFRQDTRGWDLEQMLGNPPAEQARELVHQNRRRITHAYSLEAYHKRLKGAYQSVLGCPDNSSSGKHLDIRVLLECFLAPERFIPIRT
jgi:hypothetical protein